ncbi:PucR family transcriptional regulator [Actinomadura litoris]|uniref:PucR family transcriptional regulator n=1 Tax=Actinomadura litoris TaxID=2678616 RepID=UPI001FA7DD34|nr:helix-turn-helix domain-containing protein [Actinomadura litoris]
MGDLFATLTRRVDANARRAVELYARELPEYKALASGDREHTDLLEFAVLLRRRTVELSAHDRPFTGADLAVIASVGHERGRAGISLHAHRSVLGLHSTLTVREIHEAADPSGLDDLMRLLGWIGPQGTAAQNAYTRGFLDGQRNVVPLVERVQQLAAALLAGDPSAAELARRLGLPVPDRYLLTVVRIADQDPPLPPTARAELIGVLADTDRVPMRWQDSREFVALLPLPCEATSDPSDPSEREPDEPAEPPEPAEVSEREWERALAMSAAVAEIAGRRCAVGATVADAGALPGALPLARRISGAAPVEAVPRKVTTLADVFVELGAARVPEVDRWLRGIADLLFQGPDLVSTLDAYYRHDMNRLLTAAHLYVHPRTLDYRLRRARELTGIDPTSTRGVRALSATVARILADT